MQTLNDLFVETLRDVYFAAFTEHAQETEGHVKRLDKVFRFWARNPQAKNVRR